MDKMKWLIDKIISFMVSFKPETSHYSIQLSPPTYTSPKAEYNQYHRVFLMAYCQVVLHCNTYTICMLCDKRFYDQSIYDQSFYSFQNRKKHKSWAENC